jgi:hypothetical protein
MLIASVKVRCTQAANSTCRMSRPSMRRVKDPQKARRQRWRAPKKPCFQSSRRGLRQRPTKQLTHPHSATYTNSFWLLPSLDSRIRREGSNPDSVRQPFHCECLLSSSPCLGALTRVYSLQETRISISMSAQAILSPAASSLASGGDGARPDRQCLALG